MEAQISQLWWIYGQSLLAMQIFNFSFSGRSAPIWKIVCDWLEKQ